MSRHSTFFVLTCLLVGACAPPPKPATAVEPKTEPLFYHSLPYGSESRLNPFSEFLDDAFDIFQLDERRLDHQTFGASARLLVKTVANPAATVRESGGLWEVLKNEVLPLTWNGKGGGAWTANYSTHFIGGGMLSRRMREWYAAHGVPHPELTADVAHMITHFANEINETDDIPYLRTEGLADLYLFDPAGILAFHFDGFAKFFSSRHVQLTNWPGQPILIPQDLALENSGQSYAAKIYPRPDAHWAVFTYVGLSAQAGVTYGRPDSNAISFGIGARSTSLPYDPVDPGKQYATVEPQAGVFFDRRNSLLASLLLNGGNKDRGVILNVYPNVLQSRKTPGFWLRVDEGGRIGAGIAGAFGFGLGGAVR